MGEHEQAADTAPRIESLQDLAARFYRIELSAERAASIARELVRFNRTTAAPVAPTVEPISPFRSLLIGSAPRP